MPAWPRAFTLEGTRPGEAGHKVYGQGNETQVSPYLPDGARVGG